jgi:phosphatidate cytidylyltransferase
MLLRRVVNTPLFKRAVGTVALGILFVWFIVVGDGPLFVGAAVITLVASYEFYHMMQYGGHRPLYVLGMILALIFVFDAYFEVNIARPGLAATLMLSIVWVRMEKMRQASSQVNAAGDPLLDWSLTFAGALYTGLLLSHALLLRALGDGLPLLATVGLGTAACDSGAYLIGTNFGRTKFFAHVSPNKTWEGAIGGFLLSVAVTMMSATFFDLDRGHALVLGVLVAISVIVGDLAESRIKRSVGVKDSASWIPEQGGMLDVIDGFLFAVVVSYYYAVWVMRLA